MDDYRAILRRLALRDDECIAALLAQARPGTESSALDARTLAFAQLGALIATAAPAAAFMSVTEEALGLGATREEIVGALISLLPVIGVTRAVAVAPNLGLALGYDVGEAFELLDSTGPQDEASVEYRLDRTAIAARRAHDEQR